MSSLKFWIWLAARRGLRARAALGLLASFGSPEAVFFAGEKELRCAADLNRAELGALLEKDLVAARRILADCEEQNLRVMTVRDADYPDRLRNIPDPPLVLYVKGRLPVLDDEAAVGVVGTRKCTPYGLKAAERLAFEITKAGGLIVTGLAAGIDSAAAKGALRAGGRVVGVLGTGTDVVYPAGNAGLFADVAAVGALVSEYPPGTEPFGSHFPARNRIISGISVGVVLIEAPAHSGALITAARALEQGRDVFVVPGNVDSEACEGSNRLLREGAIPAISGFDVAEEYMALYPEKLGRAGSVKREAAIKMPDGGASIWPEDRKREQKATKKEIDNTERVEYIDLVLRSGTLNAAESAVLQAIGTGEMTVDELVAGTGLPAQEILSALTMLEIGGHLARRDGKRFAVHFTVK